MLYSDDGQLIVCGSDKSTIHIWSTNPHETLYMNEHNSKSEASLGQLITQFPEPIGNNGTVSDIADSSQFTLSNNSNNIKSNNGRLRSNSRKSLSAWLRRNAYRGGGHHHQHHHHMHSTNCYFSGHHGIVTCAIFAPTKTRQQLAATGEDIIYNHTHVSYVYRNTVHFGDSRTNVNNDTDIKNSNTIEPQNNNSNKQTIFSVTNNNNTTIRTSYSMQSIQENDQQALKARLEYPYSEGQIIVSANEKGCIKVWRIDSGTYDNNNNDRASSSSSIYTGSNQRSRVSSMSILTLGGENGQDSSNNHSKKHSRPLSRLSFSSRFNQKPKK